MVINLEHHYSLKNKVLSQLPVSDNDNFIVAEIFSLVEQIYRDSNISLQDAYEKIDDFYNVHFDFFTALKNFDEAMVNIPFTPNWSGDKVEKLYNSVVNDNLPSIVDEALNRLRDNQKFIDQLFYFQVIVTGLIGGFENETVVDYMILDSYLEPYKLLKPKAVAYLLQTEYSGGTVKSVPDTVEPIDISLYPEYLIMDNPHILYKDGKAYLKIDIMNAMTAAGGFAQALERQDLEGGTTNAAPKRKKDNESKSVESDADETSRNEKKAK